MENTNNYTEIDKIWMCANKECEHYKFYVRVIKNENLSDTDNRILKNSIFEIVDLIGEDVNVYVRKIDKELLILEDNLKELFLRFLLEWFNQSLTSGYVINNFLKETKYIIRIIKEKSDTINEKNEGIIQIQNINDKLLSINDKKQKIDFLNTHLDKVNNFISSNQSIENIHLFNENKYKIQGAYIFKQFVENELSKYIQTPPQKPIEPIKLELNQTQIVYLFQKLIDEKCINETLNPKLWHLVSTYFVDKDNNTISNIHNTKSNLQNTKTGKPKKQADLIENIVNETKSNENA